MPMLDDLDVIIKKYPDDMNTLHVYGLGDVHVGSPEFNERSIRKKIQIIADDPSPELQYLEIYMYREGHKSSLRRVVNYHSIQI